jgi:hypothetical protein
MNKRLAFVSHLVVAVLAAGLAACPPPIDGCTVGATRCAGESAQVCDSDQRWTEIMNCRDVAAQSGGRWTCGVYDDGGHACLPVYDDAGVVPHAALSTCSAGGADGGAR